MTLDPAGRPFVLGFGVLTLAVFWLAPGPALAFAVVGVILVAFTLNFFRDPERTAPNTPGALISPADGRIIRADDARVSIFMNVFDVHVCRSPVAGEVQSVAHDPGRFLAAMKAEASEQNERTTIVVQPSQGPSVRFVLVAGLVARRIVCRVGPGRQLAQGERVGIIRFGSRVDLDLPPGAIPAVGIGDRVVAGESVLARYGGRPA